MYTSSDIWKKRCERKKQHFPVASWLSLQDIQYVDTQ